MGTCLRVSGACAGVYVCVRVHGCVSCGVHVPVIACIMCVFACVRVHVSCGRAFVSIYEHRKHVMEMEYVPASVANVIVT